MTLYVVIKPVVFGKLFYVTSTLFAALYVRSGHWCNNHMCYRLLLWNLCLFTLLTNLTGQSPIHRKKPLPFKIFRVMSQSGIFYERLESLERSRRGHLSTITKVCNALDETVKDFGNVVKVRTEQKQLNTAWEQYCACCDKYNDLLDTSCEKYQSVLSDRDTQRVRVQAYNDKIELFIFDAAEFYNNQVSEEIRQKEKYSQSESVKSQKSYASRLSVSSSKAREAKVYAAKAALMKQQAEERSRRAVELEVKRVEMEIKRTQLELQHRLELNKLEAEKEVMAARDQAELAKLEAFLAEQEMSELTNEKEGIK